MVLTFSMHSTFKAHGQPQVIWDVDLTTNESAPLANCTCMTLTFDLIQAWLDNAPMTGIKLDLYLLNDKYTLCNNPGFVQGQDTIITGIGLCDRYTLTGVTIPSIADGGTTTVRISAKVTGYFNDPSQSMAFKATYGTNVIAPPLGPLVIPVYQVIEVGQQPTSTNLIGAVATGGIGSLAVPPGATGQDVLIQGTLIINQDYYFTGASDIYMKPGSKIVVRDGATLRLFDKTRVRGCETPWEGIFVEHGTLWTDGSTDQSTPDKVIIENAYTAVTGQSGAGIGGITIIAKETIFRDNEKGIYLSDSPLFGWDAVVLNAEKNIFEITPASQLYGLAGIRVNNLYNTLYLQDNYYRNLPFGIWSTNSTLIVNKDKFENISDAGILVENDPGIIRSLTQTGLGQNENNPTFLNCYTGIRAINTNVRLKQNVMNKVSRGISLTNGIHKSADIIENIIRAQQFGISVNGWVTMTRFRIFDNEIYIDGETIEGSAIFTELLNGNQLGRTTISDNYIELKKIVELAKPADEAGEVVLSNALGIRFLIQKYQPGDQVIYLFLDEVPAGIYYLTARNATHSSTRIITNLK